ncbi:MAG: hypothetical protein KC592_15750 [Nitrospira sp.]|nr:hypothetical protein [Nitrospira sp.]MCW5782876.1 hypothetical protein [Nitrospirales bacterium]
MLTKVSLPDIPVGRGLEDFVAAFFQAAGQYVERSIIQRETEEVLELDLLTTAYTDSVPTHLLTEVKSGGWGFPDLFKLSGWLHYLQLQDAVFVVTKTKNKLDFYIEKARRLSVRLIIIPDLKEAAKPLAAVTGIENPQQIDVAVWRYSYWLDRIFAKDLICKKKTATIEKRYSALADYLHAINNGAFFRQTISERMDHLCSVYKDHPNISSRVSAEMVGSSFEGEYAAVENEVFKRTFYECEYNDLQISAYIEHRARLALMKHATDFILFTKSGRHDLAKDSRKLKIFNHEIECSSFESLPVTFREGIEKIKDEPYFHRYPVFWQWFMWAYGGFILLDKEEDEYAHMAARTGIPVEEIPRALEAYDSFFPTPGTWFIDTSPNACIRKLKMFPVPFMGLGAFFRRRIYEVNKFSELSLNGHHTINDLVNWNNAAVSVLNK